MSPRFGGGWCGPRAGWRCPHHVGLVPQVAQATKRDVQRSWGMGDMSPPKVT